MVSFKQNNLLLLPSYLRLTREPSYQDIVRTIPLLNRWRHSDKRDVLPAIGPQVSDAVQNDHLIWRPSRVKSKQLCMALFFLSDAQVKKVVVVSFLWGEAWSVLGYFANSCE